MNDISVILIWNSKEDQGEEPSIKNNTYTYVYTYTHIFNVNMR